MPAKTKKKSPAKRPVRTAKKTVKKSPVMTLASLSKKTRIVIFAVLFGVLGSIYLVYSYAKPDIDKRTQAVFYYSEGHAHIEYEAGFAPVDYPTILYGDGLMVCANHHTDDEITVQVRQKYLSEKEINAFKKGVEDAGAAQLKSQQYRSNDDLIDPTAAQTVVFTDFGNGSKRAIYTSGEKPAAFDAVAQYVHSYCDQQVVEPLDAESYTLNAVLAEAPAAPEQKRGIAKANEVIGNRVEQNSRLDQVVQQLEELQVTQSIAIDKATAREFKAKLGNQDIGVIESSKGKLAVRITPQIRPYVLHGADVDVSKSDNGKVFAATAKKVEFVWFYASNQSLQSGYSSKLADTSLEVRNWYKSKVPNEELIFARNYTKKGAKTISQYETCPSGKNCQGDKLLAAFYNVQSELGTLTDAEVLVIFQGSETSCKGWGGGAGMPGTNGQVKAATQGIGIINATGCTWNDGRRKISAHELGHGLGSAHYCHNYNVMATAACAASPSNLGAALLHDTQKSTWQNYSWFFKISPRYLNKGEGLYGDGYILSAKGSHKLLMQQSDGNLVLYGPSGAAWNSRTSGYSGSKMVFQSDGNLVVYKTNGKYCHASSGGKGGHRLVAQDDGNLVIYKSDLTTPVWSRKTHGWYCN